MPLSGIDGSGLRSTGPSLTNQGEGDGKRGRSFQKGSSLDGSHPNDPLGGFPEDALSSQAGPHHSNSTIVEA